MKIKNFKKIIAMLASSVIFMGGATLAFAQTYVYPTTVTGSTGTSVVAGTSVMLLTRQLGVGSRGADVSSLQTFLASNLSIYPEGLVTGYFGSLTRSAVMRFQTYFGIPAVGRVGPITLAKINSLISSGVGLSGVAGGGVVVTPVGADIFAPTITNVTVSPFTNTATVNWTTDEPSRGAVFYSTDPIQFQEITANGAIPLISGTPVGSSISFMNSQSAMISGLLPNTVYYYSVFAIDQSGNVSVTLNNSFHTTF